MAFYLTLVLRNLREVSDTTRDQIGDPAAGLGNGSKKRFAGLDCHGWG